MVYCIYFYHVLKKTPHKSLSLAKNVGLINLLPCESLVLFFLAFYSLQTNFLSFLKFAKKKNNLPSTRSRNRLPTAHRRPKSSLRCTSNFLSMTRNRRNLKLLARIASLNGALSSKVTETINVSTKITLSL